MNIPRILYFKAKIGQKFYKSKGPTRFDLCTIRYKKDNNNYIKGSVHTEKQTDKLFNQFLVFIIFYFFEFLLTHHTCIKLAGYKNDIGVGTSSQGARHH